MTSSASDFGIAGACDVRCMQRALAAGRHYRWRWIGLALSRSNLDRCLTAHRRLRATQLHGTVSRIDRRHARTRTPVHAYMAQGTGGFVAMDIKLSKSSRGEASKSRGEASKKLCQTYGWTHVRQSPDICGTCDVQLLGRCGIPGRCGSRVTLPDRGLNNVCGHVCKGVCAMDV